MIKMHSDIMRSAHTVQLSNWLTNQPTIQPTNQPTDWFTN